LKTAIEKLQKWGHDASSIFEGEQLFMDIPIHKDEIYESLFADADLDSLPQMCLKLLSYRIMLILDRQGKDQLPNGKYTDPLIFPLLKCLFNLWSPLPSTVQNLILFYRFQ
jgi:hypothetical protein